jgi:ribonuclease III
MNLVHGAYIPKNQPSFNKLTYENILFALRNALCYKRVSHIVGHWALMTLGETMTFRVLSDYFYNEYFLFTKEYSLDSVQSAIQKLVPSIFHYEFKDYSLLRTALTHKSFAHEIRLDLTHNEKLEFLGDSVLQLVISEELFRRYETLSEGDLSKLRSAIVNENTLADLGRYFKIDDLILVGKGEFKNLGHRKDSVVANAFEAIIAAIYLDSDFQTVATVLLKLIQDYENKVEKILHPSLLEEFDAKSRLQELVMAKFKTHPKYVSQNLGGDMFKVELMVNDQSIDSIEHYSKKKAMQLIAKKVLDKKLLDL